MNVVVDVPDSGNYTRHPSTESPEQGRFFSRRRSALYSLRKDGSIWCKRLTHGWRLANPVPSPEGLASQVALFERITSTCKPWQRHVDDIPTMQELEQQYREDGCCETPTGHVVEPDGTGPDGVPSWLMIFGMI